MIANAAVFFSLSIKTLGGSLLLSAVSDPLKGTKLLRLVEHRGWDQRMICESDLINDTKILSSTLCSVLAFVTFGNCGLCLLPWRGCFFFFSLLRSFSGPTTSLFAVLQLFFLFMLQLHATSHNQQLCVCVCVCNQYMACWFNCLVLESDQRKASYQSSFTHAQQINPYNIFNTFRSGWVKIRIIISGCHAAKINNFSTKQFATNRQHISGRKSKLVTIPACEGHPRSLVCSFPFFCDWRWRRLAVVSPHHHRGRWMARLLHTLRSSDSAWHGGLSPSSQEAPPPVRDARQVERRDVLRQAQVCSGCHREHCGKRRKGVWRRTELQMLWMEKRMSGWATLFFFFFFAAVAMAIRVSCYTSAGKTKNTYWFKRIN